MSDPNDDSSGNKLRATPNDVHSLIIDETANVFRQGTGDRVAILTDPPGATIDRHASTNPQRAAGSSPRGAGESSKPLGSQTLNKKGTAEAVYTSRLILTEFPFNQVIPSWNVDVPPGAGFTVELRVGRRKDDFWTSFYYLGRWGDIPPVEPKRIRDEHGVIEVDYFTSTRVFDRIQYRLHLSASDPNHPPVLRRFAMAVSNALNDESLARRHRKPIDPGPKDLWARRLPVPFRSQQAEDDKIRHDVCSPTSVSMVMEYRGVNQPTARVCEVAWDEDYRIFGNWARAVQTAYTFGVPGHIERFGSFDAVKRHIANGQPIIASIRADRGELRGAPYPHSNGHLFVIVGFDENGSVHVNDPAAASPEKGLATYAREDVAKVWLDHGGVGYVLLPGKQGG